MFVDSHCHLDFPELADNLEVLLGNMRNNEVSAALCVSVTLEKFPKILSLAERYEHIYASVGVHPDYELEIEPTLDQLAELAKHPKVIAIGETGLDYYRLNGDLEWQRERFRTHIRAAKECNKPLIVHTRSAASDTLRIMKEEGADQIGGVMHCFTESQEVAEQALEMNFYISFSGIVTFKNAVSIKEVAKNIPMDRLLIESDAPYLAPVPYRGKLNQPAYVVHVADEIAKLRGLTRRDIGAASTLNFNTLFLNRHM